MSSDPTTWVCRCGDRHPVPTDASAYRVTEHFEQRLKYRTDPAPDSDIIARCFENPPKRGHTGEQYRYFDSTVDGVQWRIVVALHPRAAHQNGKHRAVTIFAPNHHDRRFDA